jgi:GT2 family glycosyltransferase
MPYNCHNEEWLHCIPLKVFEYFAFGIPVVSTPLVHLWEYKDLIYFGDTAEELAGAVEQALQEPPDSPKRAARVEVARRHSVDNLAAELRECLPLGSNAEDIRRLQANYSGANAMRASVVIPTYRRPSALLDCVRSLVEANRRPEEVIVVGRAGDTSTNDALTQAQSLCAGKTNLRIGWVTEPGHVPPVHTGLALASGDIVAFVDDDITATKDWLECLVAPFSDPDVGVVGGRVIAPVCEAPRFNGKPGCISWYGKHWGNVAGIEGNSPVEVQSVMECNWAWRRELLVSLRFDPTLNFDDASMYGLDLCLQATAKGFRVIYEPRAAVLHHVAPRAPGLDRGDRPRRNFSYTRNYTYIMLKHLPRWKHPIFLAWWFLVGERGAWGLASWIAYALRGCLPRATEVQGAIAGKLQGIQLSGRGARAHA